MTDLAAQVPRAAPWTADRAAEWDGQTYEPALPVHRAQLTQRMPQGSAIECEAVYDRPFWRDDGLTGQATSDDTPVRITYDNSPPSGRPGVLLGFIEGEAARRWGSRPLHQRRAAVLRNCATYLGARARHPRRYIEMSWGAERWTRGCYVGFIPPGVLLDYGPAIRDRIGRIHWAGAETATIWNGYMDGAVRAGERAAQEVLAAL
jgi:monoamine oxidase